MRRRFQGFLIFAALICGLWAMLPAQKEGWITEEGPIDEAEEPPTYDGSWRKLRKDCTLGKTHHFHGEELHDSLIPKVYHMEIRSFNGGAIPSWIGKMKALRALHIDQNGVLPLPAAIWSLTGLTSLEISYMDLEVVSPRIGQLRNLQRLRLTTTVGKPLQLPATLGNLQALESLEIGWCKASNWTAALGRLKQLRTLRLQMSELAVVPPVVWTLTNLDTLDLSFNALTSIPPEICNLKRLRHLDMTGNEITHVPEELRPWLEGILVR